MEWKVVAKDTLNSGDRIFLPHSVREMPTPKLECRVTAKEINFIRSLVIYKVFDFNSLIFSFLPVPQPMLLCVCNTILYDDELINSKLGSCHSCPQQTSRIAGPGN